MDQSNYSGDLTKSFRNWCRSTGRKQRLMTRDLHHTVDRWLSGNTRNFTLNNRECTFFMSLHGIVREISVYLAVKEISLLLLSMAIISETALLPSVSFLGCFSQFLFHLCLFYDRLDEFLHFCFMVFLSCNCFIKTFCFLFNSWWKWTVGCHFHRPWQPFPGECASSLGSWAALFIIFPVLSSHDGEHIRQD